MRPSILITGALGGMGKATAKALSDMGLRVFAMDKIAGEDDEHIVSIEADVTNEESVKNAFDKVREMTDELYGIVHFAGIYMLDSLVEMSSEDFEKIFRINLGGVYLVNKIFLPLLNKRACTARPVAVYGNIRRNEGSTR